MADEPTTDAAPVVADLVPSHIWMPNENGRFERSTAFPSRRAFLQRVRPGDGLALLEWVDPMGAVLAPGSPVDLRIRVAKKYDQVIACEVESSRQERGSSAGHTVYRFGGSGFIELAELHAQIAGRASAHGFRDGERFPTDIAVRVDGGRKRARVIDLSRRGLQLSMREGAWEVGDLMQLQVRRGWFRREELGVRVVWATGNGRESRFGARIVEAHPRTQRWLAETLTRWSTKRGK